MANTQTPGGTSAQQYGMYLPMPAAGHHNMIHQPIHQVEYSSEQAQYIVNQDQSIQVEYESEQVWHQNNNQHHHHNNNNNNHHNNNKNHNHNHHYAPADHNHQQVNDNDVSDISFFAD